MNVTKPHKDMLENRAKEIICYKCGHLIVRVLKGVSLLLSADTLLECTKCGNKYILGEVKILGEKWK